MCILLTGNLFFRLNGYIRISLEGDLLSKGELLELAQDGLEISIELKHPLYTFLFKHVVYLLENQYEQYYTYLSEKALPFFRM